MQKKKQYVFFQWPDNPIFLVLTLKVVIAFEDKMPNNERFLSIEYEMLYNP